MSHRERRRDDDRGRRDDDHHSSRKRRSRSRSRERGTSSRSDGKDGRRHGGGSGANLLQLKTGSDSSSKREKLAPSTTDLRAPDLSLLAPALPIVDEEEETRRIMEKLRQEEEAEEKKAKALEESRRRRQEIMAKHAQASPLVKQQQQQQQPQQQQTPNVAVATPAAAVAAVQLASNSMRPPPPPPPPPLPKAEPAMMAADAGGADEDDVFDMFSDKALPETGAQLERTTTRSNLAHTEIRTDAEGYGSITAGRILGGRYRVIGEAGKGVFSTVVRCTDLHNQGAEVVVKVARLNEAMKRAGRKEIEYLRLLTKRDPENKYCTVRMLDSFDDQDFLCVVLEALDISLRETVYLYGQGEGLSIAAVRYYCKRVLMALYHMKQCGLVHTDLKLDNLLVDKDRKVLKVADFGSTRRVTEFIKGKAEELCPLWYRPPEVIVGFPYMSYSLDMWCLGNILFELATGTVLFQGNSLNEQLKMYIEHLGVLPKKMVRNADAYFYNGDPTKFLHTHMDSVTGRPITSIIDVSREPHISLKERILDFFVDVRGEEKKSVLQLHDLISNCLTLHPRKRLTVEEALKHPFVAGTVPAAAANAATAAPVASGAAAGVAPNGAI